MIDSQQASEALNDINAIVQRVRQSRIYNITSIILIMWGGLIFAGHIATFLWPRFAAYAWLAVYVVGIAGSFAISAYGYPKIGVRTFNVRMLVALLLFIAFGIFCCWLGHFTTTHQFGTFWTIYFMMVYTIAGLWVGYAFLVIGLGVTVLTLIGYFFLGGWFDPWMAFVSGGGLIVGGLWMRRS